MFVVDGVCLLSIDVVMTSSVVMDIGVPSGTVRWLNVVGGGGGREGTNHKRREKRNNGARRKLRFKKHAGERGARGRGPLCKPKVIIDCSQGGGGTDQPIKFICRRRPRLLSSSFVNTELIVGTSTDRSSPISGEGTKHPRLE